MDQWMHPSVFIPLCICHILLTHSMLWLFGKFLNQDSTGGGREGFSLQVQSS